MNIIILAAGQGTRLRPYTNHLPKCLVSIDGQSLLETQIAVIKSCGINKIYAVTGYCSEKLETFPIIKIFNPFFQSTNMVSSLFCAKKILDHESIISYGDIVYSRKILKGLMNTKNDISVVIDKEWKSYWSKRSADYISDIESLELSKENNIINIGDKVLDEKKVQGQYIGLIKLTQRGAFIFKKVYKECESKGMIGNKSFTKAFMTDFLQEIINLGYDVSAFITKDLWIEIDTISDLQLSLNKDRIANIKNEIN